MSGIEEAIGLAVERHRGQKDKAGAPYILHPLRVMARMDDDLSRMAAVLHDLVEDTPTTLEELLRRGFPEAVVTAVDCLTRREDESYEDFIRRLKPNAIARKVKVGDLEDNMDLRRLRDPRDKDWERLGRYRRYWAELVSERL